MVKDQHRRVDDHTLASSNTDFAFSLYKQLALENPDKNVIFSPLSISIALAFLSLGARGSTLTEIVEGLKFNLTEIQEKEIHQGFQHLLQTLNPASNELQLSAGNAMFVQHQLKLLDKFIEDARVLYSSEAFSTNFGDQEAAKSLINGYVKNKTQGKIEELFKFLSPNTVLVLVNYIYFKGGCPVDSEGNVPLVLCLQGCFYFSSANSVAGHYRGSCHQQIHKLYLPKFSIKSDYELNDILSQLGIKKIFTDPDLSGITGTGNLAVSQVSLESVDNLSSYQSVKRGGWADGSSPGICKINAFPVTQSPSLGLPKPRRAGCNH
ncbi:SERPINA3-5, partial [Cervus elaphus hippelaphus]